MGKSFSLKIFRSSLAFCAALLSTGCGSQSNPASSLVNNLTVRSFQQDLDQWVEVTAALNTGGFALGGVNIPIIDPTHPYLTYGQIRVAPSLCGASCNGGDLTLALNLTQSTHAQSIDPLLPNGTPLPVGGLQNATVVALPVGNAGGRIYFAFGKGVALLGTAIPFAALDPAGQYVPGLNLFQPIQFGSVNASVGIFAGSALHTTGVGLFVDLSSVVTPNTTLADLTGGANATVRSAGYEASTAFKSKIAFKSIRGKPEAEKLLLKRLIKLNDRGTRLEIE